RAESEDRRAGLLEHVGRALAAAGGLCQSLQRRDMAFDSPGDVAELVRNRGLVLEVFDLTVDCLLDVLFQRQHVRDIAVQRFTRILGSHATPLLCSSSGSLARSKVAMGEHAALY